MNLKRGWSAKRTEGGRKLLTNLGNDTFALNRKVGAILFTAYALLRFLYFGRRVATFCRAVICFVCLIVRDESGDSFATALTGLWMSFKVIHYPVDRFGHRAAWWAELKQSIHCWFIERPYTSIPKCTFRCEQFLL